MFSKVDDPEAATSKLLNEMILLLDIAVMGINKPASLSIGSCPAIVLSNGRYAESTP
jgi:hypothetical protein